LKLYCRPLYGCLRFVVDCREKMVSAIDRPLPTITRNGVSNGCTFNECTPIINDLHLHASVFIFV